MHTLTIAFCVALGLVIGSFLNVVIWRVPRAESIVTPRSRCTGCGHEIRSRDNIPIVSWLVLRGSCRDCRARVSARYPIVELATGTLFALLGWRFGFGWELPAFLYLGGVGIALAVIDFDVHRLPDVLTLPSYAVGAALLAIAAVAEGKPSRMVGALLGMAALYAFYLVLHYAYPHGMGRGDVKLAGVLGLFLGYLGWPVLLVGAFLGFLLGGVVGGVMMAIGRATRKSMIPFGPFMIAGALLAVFVGRVIANAYSGATLH